MARPPTTFDTPQFKLRVDSEWRQYANVNNLATLTDEDGIVVEQFPVVVPTEMFTLMKDALGVGPKETVGLYFDVDGKLCFFGITVPGRLDVDLWAYSQAILPDFLKPHLTLAES